MYVLDISTKNEKLRNKIKNSSSFLFLMIEPLWACQRCTLLIPASSLYKSIAGRYRPVRVADGPITARYRFIKNVYWDLECLSEVVRWTKLLGIELWGSHPSTLKRSGCHIDNGRASCRSLLFVRISYSPAPTEDISESTSISKTNPSSTLLLHMHVQYTFCYTNGRSQSRNTVFV